MENKLKLNNVRLSFPSLFGTMVIDGVDTGKYGANLLLDKVKDKAQLKAVKALEAEFIEETFKGNPPKGLKLTYWSDGDDTEWDGYAGNFALSASNRKRLTLIDKKKIPVVEKDNLFYGGCYVNALVSFWYSEHVRGGKQILMNLHIVQFAKDGEPFGSGNTGSIDDFDEVENETDDYDF